MKWDWPKVGNPTNFVDVRELEIAIDWTNDLQVEPLIDGAIVDSDLRVTLRDTLRAFPGSVHWHLKRGREVGTLEITVWPDRHQAWFSIQDGRKGDWIDQGMQEILAALGRRTRNT